jgi:hypothetical protein
MMFCGVREFKLRLGAIFGDPDNLFASKLNIVSTRASATFRVPVRFPRRGNGLQFCVRVNVGGHNNT